MLCNFCQLCLKFTDRILIHNILGQTIVDMNHRKHRFLNQAKATCALVHMTVQLFVVPRQSHRNKREHERNCIMTLTQNPFMQKA